MTVRNGEEKALYVMRIYYSKVSETVLMTDEERGHEEV